MISCMRNPCCKGVDQLLWNAFLCVSAMGLKTTVVLFCCSVFLLVEASPYRGASPKIHSIMYYSPSHPSHRICNFVQLCLDSITLILQP